MKLNLILLFVAFFSLQALANVSDYEDVSVEDLAAEAEADRREQMDDQYEEEMPIQEAALPQDDIANEEEVLTTTQTFQEDAVVSRLNQEMTYLNSEADKVAKAPVAVAANEKPTEKIVDLEEKINFRAAAVKREDNMGPDEVDVSDLDPDIFR